MKTEFITSNPAVCLQVEEVRDAHNWKSVIVMGRAGLLTDSAEREKANNLIALINPSHAPAISKTSIGASIRQNMVEIYRIDPRMMSGRKTRRVLDRD
jgi:nitroimidazol reductase NimA-like FMN-containing flavoprotein (pyridoxamine 5'-phosphate oxidase superfamily)